MTFNPRTLEEQSDAELVLHFAREMLPGRWCQGADALTSTWQKTTAGAEDATSFCVVGALRRGSRHHGCNVLPALDALHAAVCALYPWNKEIPAAAPEAKADVLREWNDGTARDVNDVIHVLDYALLRLLG